MHQVDNLSQPSNHFLNMNCLYDFRPSNFNFLLLSRLSLALKKKRIHKLVRKRVLQKRQELQSGFKDMENEEKDGVRA